MPSSRKPSQDSMSKAAWPSAIHSNPKRCEAAVDHDRIPVTPRDKKENFRPRALS